jgi:hypothetical protein
MPKPTTARDCRGHSLMKLGHLRYEPAANTLAQARAALGEGEMTESLAEALPREINRVRSLQDRFKELRGTPNVIVEPQIEIMEIEIKQAIKACAEGDVVAMIASYQTLKEYD